MALAGEKAMTAEIVTKSASWIAQRVSNRSLSCCEVMEIFVGHIGELNPVLNAICTLNNQAMEQAHEADRQLALGQPPRPLEGVPILVKDTLHTKGIRTTFGSLIREHYVPEEDALSVERLKNAGAIVLGKTNTPEFAHDVNTNNLIFGTTRNPFDVNVTAGGSSGGSGSAVAAAMAPIALGTDLGGSIRIPCSYNGIVGIRPTPGRVPVYPTEFGWDTLVEHVQGPMTRSVSDLALALSVLAGPDDRDPSSLPDANCDYLSVASEQAPLHEKRIAYVGNLNGLFPLDPEVEQLTTAAALRFENLGCIVEKSSFDVSGIREIITGTRGFGMIARYADLFDKNKDNMTPQLVNQVTNALELDVRIVVNAERDRTAYWHRVREFLEQYDYIVAPCAGAPPFRLDEPLPTQVGGSAVERYYDVYLATYAFSVTGLPITAVPCGLTQNGLPVGMQIIGHRHRDDSVIRAAAAYERECPENFVHPLIDLNGVKPVSPALTTPGLSIR
jgi:amidase